MTSIGLLAGASSSAQPLSIGEQFNLAQVRGAAVNAQPNFLLDTKYVRSAGNEEFKVSAEGADPGFYDVFIDGSRRGQLRVTTRTDAREVGEVFFRSPVTVDSYPLDFDPRGITLELYKDGVLQYGTTLSR